MVVQMTKQYTCVWKQNFNVKLFMKKTILFTLTALSVITTTACAAWNGKIVDIGRDQSLTREALMQELAQANIVVIGEKHYTKEVQNEEGKLINDLVTFTNKQRDFSLSWEFLNASSQNVTQTHFDQVLMNQMSADDFLFKTQGNTKASVYAPMIAATAKLTGQLFGVNLSREEKAPVTKGGLAALDPKLLPPNFEMGGANYLERFTETMQGHATPEQIKNYFASQSLVDDVSAYHVIYDSKASLKFLVIGAFHSQYNDGVVARLKVRDPNAKIANVEIIDAADYTAAEIEDVFTDPKYGNRADYILFVNEPN